jgi:hypothetical protein
MEMYKQEQFKKDGGLFHPSRQLFCTAIPISLRMPLNPEGGSKNNKKQSIL